LPLLLLSGQCTPASTCDDHRFDGGADINTKRFVIVSALAVVLLAVVYIVINTAEQVDRGSWVTVDNIKYKDSESVFYVLEKKSPFGDNEKFEDSEGYRRICLLLEFVPAGAENAGDEQSFVAMPFDDRLWELCRELKLTGKPSFDANSVPAEFRADITGS
jgi:hypothetical protein